MTKPVCAQGVVSLRVWVVRPRLPTPPAPSSRGRAYKIGQRLDLRERHAFAGRRHALELLQHARLHVGKLEPEVGGVAQHAGGGLGPRVQDAGALVGERSEVGRPDALLALALKPGVVGEETVKDGLVDGRLGERFLQAELADGVLG